jgi:uncharacterized caspase-like protein
VKTISLQSFAFVVTFLLTVSVARADEMRFALVIGNAGYQNGITKLSNPVNDASDMAALLKRLGFNVILLTDVNYSQMRDGIRKFYEQLDAAPKGEAIALFYYAGHGVQFDNENYLVPVDANVQYSDDIPRMCLSVHRTILTSMEASRTALNIVILDACRNNPFPSSSRSITSGLVETQRAKGSFIAYATAPGSVASDGTGRNGLYTQELLKAMQIPGLLIEQVFKEVRRNVLKQSGEKQYTWDSSNILGDFFFIKSAPDAKAKTVPLPAPVAVKKVVTEEKLGQELSALTSPAISFKERQKKANDILTYFVVPHAFVNLYIGPRLDERLAANILMTRLVTYPETQVRVISQETADSGHIIELHIEVEE